MPNWLKSSLHEVREAESDQDIVPVVNGYKDYYNALDGFFVEVKPLSRDKNVKKLGLTISGSGNKYRRIAKFCTGFGLMVLGAWSWYTVAKTRPDIAWGTLRQLGRGIFGGVVAPLGGIYMMWKNPARVEKKQVFEDFISNKEKSISKYVEQHLFYGGGPVTFYNDGFVLCDGCLRAYPKID